jgi:hypothetical protein
MEVNSLGPKTLCLQGALAGRSLLERESLLAVVGGGRAAGVNTLSAEISTAYELDR